MGGNRKSKVIAGIAVGAAVIIVAAVCIAVLHRNRPESIPMVLQQTRVQEPADSKLPREDANLFSSTPNHTNLSAKKGRCI